MQRQNLRLFLPLALLLAARAASAAGDPENGKTLYLAHGCYSCHGYNGIGRRQLANDASAFLQNETVFTVYLRLRANIETAGPSNSMPNYSAEVISDPDAADLFAYIKTLVDNPPALEDIAVLSEAVDRAQQRSAGD